MSPSLCTSVTAELNVEDSLKSSLVSKSLCRVLRQIAGRRYDGNPRCEKTSTVTKYVATQKVLMWESVGLIYVSVRPTDLLSKARRAQQNRSKVQSDGR